MPERIGIIGVGHLAVYVVEGFQRAAPDLEITLSPRSEKRSAKLAERPGITVAVDNQSVANSSDLILVMTRPLDIEPVCRAIRFRMGQEVVSTAAGVTLERLEGIVAPAVPSRSMPITCAAINRSPTLLYPDRARVRTIFELLGSVIAVANEDQFTTASAIPAFYGWVYALFDATTRWTEQAGLPAEISRKLVLETARGAAEMGLANPQAELGELLDSLATPGGITRKGLKELHEREALMAWAEALQIVHESLKSIE
ncbi:MAG: NAD(P)-binding domain-containing protein [bacterium]|nr:NAD(P)-binding domain-containing protein [bacterium]